MIEEPENVSLVARGNGVFLIDGIFVEEKVYRNRYSRYSEECNLYRTKLAIYELLSCLDTDDRQEVMNEFCRFCGEEGTGPCTCMRDD